MAEDASPAGLEPPSPWLRRFAALFVPGARVVDVACGTGRHARWLASRGCRVLAVDRDLEALRGLAACPGVSAVQADLEAAAGGGGGGGGGWPLTPAARFDAVVVTRYLWRARLPELCAALAPGGALVYETFTAGHERLGRPRRADFLLRSGELLELADEHGLSVVAYEEGSITAPKAARVQRMLALRPPLLDVQLEA